MDNTDTHNNLSLVFAEIPDGLPEPGQHLTVEKRPLDTNNVPDGGLLARMIYSSLDPYLRLLLVPAHQGALLPPFEIGETLRSAGLAQVFHSRNPNFQKDEIIRGSFMISEYIVLSSSDLSDGGVEVINTALPLTMWLGPIGLPGETAYCSLFEIGKPQAGETIFISAAAGAVGQVVGQISKNLGLTVIGSVGSQAKLDDIVHSLGFDDGFIYKNEDPDTALARLCPQGIDIYYDNVGGAQLEAALNHMNKHGRIVVCGMVSQYNIPPDQRYGVKNLFKLIDKSIAMQGFQVTDKDMRGKWGADHQRDMAKWLANKNVKGTIDETVGIRRGAEAFKKMLIGENYGKAVLRIWEDFQQAGWK